MFFLQNHLVIMYWSRLLKVKEYQSVLNIFFSLYSYNEELKRSECS